MSGGRVAPLRIGYVVKMFPRLSETFVLNEVLELERRGVELTIFSLKKPDEGRFQPQLSCLRAPVVYLEDIASKKGLAALTRSWPALRPHRDQAWEALDRAFAQPDGLELLLASAVVAGTAAERRLHHLHAHFASSPTTVAYLASRLSGLAFSFTAHAKDIYLNTVDAAFLQEKLKAARFVVTVCEFNRHHLLSSFKGLDPEAIRVIYNGIDLDLFSFEAETREEKLILSVGRLVPKKGFDVLLEACAILRSRGVPFRCAIVGDGPERGRLEMLLRERRLTGAVELLGARTQAEVLAGLKRATVLALACIEDRDGNRDGLPTVLLEALGTGCPVVSTPLTGIPEIVASGRDGLLVPPGDPTALAEALTSVLTSPSVRAEWARRGRRKAEERFDLKKSAAALEDYFRARRRVSVAFTQTQPVASA